MKLKHLSLASLVFVAMPLSASDGKIMLAHTFTKDDADQYKMSLSIEESGSTMELKAEYTVTTVKPTEDGGAEFEFKVTKFDGPMETSNIPVLKGKLDKFGLFKEMELKDAGVLSALYSICNYLPKGEFAANEKFAVDWKSVSGVTIKGDGKLASVDAAKGTFKMRYELAVVPEGDHAGKLILNSEFNSKNGKLIAATGDVTLDNGSATFKVENATKK